MLRRFIGKKKVGTIIFDKSISAPANISGDINAGVIAKILSKFRRCLVKKTAAGQVTIAYLRDDNSNYYEDGTPAILTGSDGDVMVHMPEFYYKYEKIDENRFCYHFSLSYKPDWMKIEESLLGAYEAYIDNSRAYSRSNVNSTGSEFQSSFKIYAANRGAGYQIIDYQQHCIIAMMFYAKYGTRHSQAVLGTGIIDSLPVTGTSNEKGIRDTINETTGYVNFLGIEAVIGGKYEWVDGVTILNNLWTITESNGTVRTASESSSNASGWIVNMLFEKGPYLDMIPTNVAGGSESTYYTNYCARHYSATTIFVLARSGGNSSNTASYAGITCTSINNNANAGNPYFGSRLAFRGKIQKATNVVDFKNIPLID